MVIKTQKFTLILNPLKKVAKNHIGFFTFFSKDSNFPARLRKNQKSTLLDMQARTGDTVS
jgi:hypothetical protein